MFPLKWSFSMPGLLAFWNTCVQYLDLIIICMALLNELSAFTIMWLLSKVTLIPKLWTVSSICQIKNSEYPLSTRRSSADLWVPFKWTASSLPAFGSYCTQKAKQNCVGPDELWQLRAKNWLPQSVRNGWIWTTTSEVTQISSDYWSI